MLLLSKTLIICFSSSENLFYHPNFQIKVACSAPYFLFLTGSNFFFSEVALLGPRAHGDPFFSAHQHDGNISLTRILSESCVINIFYFYKFEWSIKVHT